MLSQRTSCRSLAAVVAVLAGLAVATSPASAASSTGAQRINTSQCDTFPEFGTFCVNQRSVFNTTQTPSGNLSVQGHADFHSLFTGDGPLTGCSQTIDISQSERFLFRGTVVQVNHFGFDELFVLTNCFGEPPRTCT